MGPAVLLLFVAMLAAAPCAVLAHSALRQRTVTRALGREVAGLRWQAIALAAEIARRVRAKEAFDPDFFLTWRLSAPMIFPALGADFGLLPGGALDRVGYFYAQLANARERLALAAAQGAFHPSPYRILTALVRASYDIEPWVEPYLDIVTREIPDRSDVSALLDELESAQTEPIALAYIWADACSREGQSTARP
jgi:hypothetical protein